MPYAVVSKGSGYVVKNLVSGRVYSNRPMSKVKAEAQLRILEAVEKKT
jgi:hypothetical protein